jgi:hypothetical protein
MSDEIQAIALANDETQSKIKNGDFSKEAKLVLEYMQKRDYGILDTTMNRAKDVNVKDLSFGRMALDIPVDHYEVLKLIYPDLACPDAQIKKKAWQAFCISDESLPYKPNIMQRKM